MWRHPPCPSSDVERCASAGVGGWQWQFGVVENAYDYTWLSLCLCAVILSHLSPWRVISKLCFRGSPKPLIVLTSGLCFSSDLEGFSKNGHLLSLLSPPPARVYNLFYPLILSASIWVFIWRALSLTPFCLSRIFLPPRALLCVSWIFSGATFWVSWGMSGQVRRW